MEISTDTFIFDEWFGSGFSELWRTFSNTENEVFSHQKQFQAIKNDCTEFFSILLRGINVSLLMPENGVKNYAHLLCVIFIW